MCYVMIKVMKTAYIYAKITTDFLFIVSVWDIC